MHGTFALLPPSPFVDGVTRLSDTRASLLEAQAQLRGRRSKATAKRFCEALDAVWSAQEALKS